MPARIALVAAIAGLAAFAFHHAAPRPAIVTQASIAAPSPGRRLDSLERTEIVVYVAGAVRRPGLYRLGPRDRAAQAVVLAGGFTPSADAGGVNLAQHAQDGDEIFVPAVGEARHASVSARARRHTRRHAVAPEEESVDVNLADADQLATVPGIGRAVAGRIVELRAREGSFTSLDELLDVAGMSQSRLDRARPFLRNP